MQLTHTLYDVQGRVLYKSITPTSRYVYDVSWLPNGAYVPEVDIGGDRLMKRFTVVR